MDSSFSRTYSTWSRSRRHHLWAWILVNALLAAAGLALKPLAVDTNIMSVLPNFGLDRSLDAAVRRMSGSANSGFYLLVAHPDFETARLGAEAIRSKVAGNPELESLTARIDEGTYSSFTDYLFENRYLLLPESERKRLEAGQGGKVAGDALRDIYSPASIGMDERLDLDPFALAPAELKTYLGSGLLQGVSVSPRDGVLAAQKEGTWYVLEIGRLKGASVGTGGKGDFVPSLKSECESLKAATPGLRVVYSGVPFHTYESSQSAQAQIAWISTVASVLTFGLTLVFFRSFLPLGATLFSLAAGIFAALASTNLIFGSVHIFTLLFGTSLIGNAVDFALLFFAEWKNPDEPGDGRSALKRVLGQITLALATTLISYFALCTAPFPLIKQIAVFSIFGLIGSYIAILLVAGPIRAPRASSRKLPIGFSERLFGAYESLGARPAALKVLVLALLAAATVLGFSRLHAGNDIRTLYTVSPSSAAPRGRPPRCSVSRARACTSSSGAPTTNGSSSAKRGFSPCSRPRRGGRAPPTPLRACSCPRARGRKNPTASRRRPSCPLPTPRPRPSASTRRNSRPSGRTSRPERESTLDRRTSSLEASPASRRASGLGGSVPRASQRSW